VQGAEIITIEGLHPEGQHPLQKSWIDYQVPQCGYCQSGAILHDLAQQVVPPGV